MESKSQNPNVIQSVWRRIKKDIKVRDLQPVKDVKGGSGVTGNFTPITGGTGITGTTAYPKTEEIRGPIRYSSFHKHWAIKAPIAAIISDILPFGRLWYSGPNAASNAIDHAKFFSRSHDAAIRVYDETGDVIDRHAQGAGDFKE